MNELNCAYVNAAQYEKMYARVLESALAGSAIKHRIFHWARHVASRWADVKLAGSEPRDGRSRAGLGARRRRSATRL